jgi:hypothetical protein
MRIGDLVKGKIIKYRRHEVLMTDGRVLKIYNKTHGMWLRSDRELMPARSVVRKMAALSRHAQVIVEDMKKFHDNNKTWVVERGDGRSIAFCMHKGVVTVTSDSCVKPKKREVKAGARYKRLESRMSMLSAAWHAYSGLLLSLVHVNNAHRHPSKEMAVLGVNAAMVRVRDDDFEVWLTLDHNGESRCQARSPDWPWSDIRSVEVREMRKVR